MTVTPAPGPYSDVIRQRWRRPAHRGELHGANAAAEDVNPLCGDRVRMMVTIDGGQVTAAGFTGDSCAICTASADVVAEMAIGLAVDAGARLTTIDVLGVLDADIRPMRMQCVALPVNVLHQALTGYQRT